LGQNTIETGKFIELQHGKQADNQENETVGPFVDAYACDYAGGSQEARDNSLGKVIIFCDGSRQSEVVLLSE
jgi:hypothetical protein